MMEAMKIQINHIENAESGNKEYEPITSIVAKAKQASEEKFFAALFFGRAISYKKAV
jgi:hypothetical protein